jgi:hypothetical protein
MADGFLRVARKASLKTTQSKRFAHAGRVLAIRACQAAF